MSEFRRAALPLDDVGLSEVVELLGIGVTELWAVLTVETRGSGFLDDRRPVILFERHYFSRLTNGRFDGSHPEISNPRWGGYGAGGANQYRKLEEAITLDREAALKSCSWGLGQVMGSHAESLGYQDVEDMVMQMCDSESAQLMAVARFLKANKLDRHLRNHDWASFARGYNGPSYAQNSYDKRMQAAYERFRVGVLPDVEVRAAQMMLNWLGYNAGPVDGLMGRFTRSSITEFQFSNELPIESEVDATLLSALHRAVRALP